MTSFLRPIMSKLSRSWSINPIWAMPAVFLAVLLLHGGLIGLTDDEAYYWVLAQNPSLGYAYHPPGVAWLIAASEALLGWAFGAHSEALVRLPGLLCMALTLGLGMKWMELAGAPRERLGRGAWVCLSFAGVFALSWMMVPDLPLFLGWTALFVSVWYFSFVRAAGWLGPLMALAMALTVLSKYSGVLAWASAVACLFAWAPKARRWRAIGWVSAGLLVGVLPTLIWNARHEWSSILWQLRDRHGHAELSWGRYARFWSVELFATGPAAVVFAGALLYRAFRKGAEGRVYRFVALWMLPAAAVFCVQPLWAEFKPHWAFIVWWPAVLVLGWEWASGARGASRWALGQAIYGTVLGAVVLVSCHLPLGSWALERFVGREFDPRMDVTNDLYGWDELEGFIAERFGAATLAMPVVGARYQTASQAAFALRSHRRATLLPLDLKARDEWPDLGVSAGLGPDWPKLTRPVLFVTDNRYDGAPGFPEAACQKLGRLEKRRLRYPAKWIEVWKCEPAAAQP
ncbi:MAG: hypothetical protein NDJ90_00610 [Oligoflexia bacterium]|nr:hypothetical protein [Oligoflexia bacterium]